MDDFPASPLVPSDTSLNEHEYKHVSVAIVKEDTYDSFTQQHQSVPPTLNVLATVGQKSI